MISIIQIFFLVHFYTTFATNKVSYNCIIYRTNLYEKLHFTLTTGRAASTLATSCPLDWTSATGGTSLAYVSWGLVMRPSSLSLLVPSVAASASSHLRLASRYSSGEDIVDKFVPSYQKLVELTNIKVKSTPLKTYCKSKYISKNQSIQLENFFFSYR